MGHLRDFASRHPVAAYIVLSFTYTWAVWFCVPAFAGSDWALGKILVGAGFGPAIAAIALDHLRGTGGRIGSRRWWRVFWPVAVTVAAIDFSILITGDAISAEEFSAAQPPGLTVGGIAASIVAAAIAGFTAASLACSRSRELNSIARGRAPKGLWLVALFLPASWMLFGLMVRTLGGGPIDTVTQGLPIGVWTLFVARSFLFTLLVVAIGEEAGWRGFMLPRLQERFSPLVSSVIVGVVWGLWHFPLFVIGQYEDAPQFVFAKAGACVILSILFTALYNRSGGFLLLAVVLHTALNTTPRLLPATDAMGVAMLSIVVGWIFFDRMWRR